VNEHRCLHRADA